MAESVAFTSPVGRIVRGSLYDPQTEDFEGRPLVIKTGANAGKPRVDYFFALAIAKGGEQHWNQTPWGRLIWDAGQKAWPSGQANSPSFSWKITDGDSPVPDKRGRKPCDREGYPRHWVLAFSSSYPPRIFNSNGTQAITEPGAVKLGYYVQVAGSVSGNGSPNQPGVFLNHSMIALAGYGAEIVVGPDPSQAGFGGQALPAGASATPIGDMGAAPPVPGAAPAYAPPPAVAAAPAYAPPVPGAAPAYAPPPAVAPAVVPHTAFLGGPGAPPPPPVAPAAPVRQMLPAAQGATYEAMIAVGWTDVQLVQHGMMVG